MFGIIGLLKKLFGFLTGITSYQSKKLDLNNSPEMQQAKEAQLETDAQDKTRAAIAQKDLYELRKEGAE
jgi:hypothetical protein